MLLTFLSLLCALCALTTIVTFVGYVRARMAVRDENPVWREDAAHPADSIDPDHPGSDRPPSGRNAELDRKELTWRSIHFITLFAFVVLGVIILVILSGRAE